MSGIEAVDPDINVINVRKEKLHVYGYANTSLVPRRLRGGGGGGGGGGRGSPSPHPAKAWEH